MKYLFAIVLFFFINQNKIDCQRIIIYSDKKFSYTLRKDSIDYVDYLKSNDSAIKEIIITRLSDNKVIQKIIPEDNDFDRAGKEGFIIEDMNFDGFNDFRLCEIRGNHANAYYYWIYNPISKKFARDTSLEQISSPYFDQKKKRIEEGWHEAGYFGQNVYKWINKKAVCIFQEQDSPIYYGDDEPNNKDEDGNGRAKFRIITINKLVNGKLKEVYSRKFTEKEYEKIDSISFPKPD